MSDVTKMAFMAPDPKLITVDFNQIEVKAAERREHMEKLNPPKPEGPEAELRGLRNQLFCLTERAKSTETYTNNKAGEVRLLEQQLTTAIRQKKEAVATGNDLAERYCERAIQRCEKELDAA